MEKFHHQPVLLGEVLSSLKPRPGGRYLDGTVGGAGHASAILEQSSPDGWLWGFDQDADAIEAAGRRLGDRFAGRFELRLASFAVLEQWVPPETCDGVLLDLGVSSPQLDRAERGFSFQNEGPLDMRMDRRNPITAASLVNEAEVEELARIFWEYGGERDSRRIARAIARARGQRRVESTRQLADLIEHEVPRHGQRSHPATKVFQALRIVVNDEIQVLRRGLDACWKVLKPEGVLAVITFHSLEDRIVKEFGRGLARDYEVPGEVDVPELRKPKPPELSWISRKAIQPGDLELRENPRARSAQLRLMRKLNLKH
ncbi:MAG: Ribosomal small subunit methyltransferase [Verrucomicrobiales bacterium]|nr:Ribosomal small subunit methyltransferase [Verrucomicrobiales bacterium]